MKAKTPSPAMAIAKYSSLVSSILQEQEGESHTCRGKHEEAEIIGH